MLQFYNFWCHLNISLLLKAADLYMHKYKCEKLKTCEEPRWCSVRRIKFSYKRLWTYETDDHIIVFKNWWHYGIMFKVWWEILWQPY